MEILNIIYQVIIRLPFFILLVIGGIAGYHFIRKDNDMENSFGWLLYSFAITILYFASMKLFNNNETNKSFQLFEVIISSLSIFFNTIYGLAFSMVMIDKENKLGGLAYSLCLTSVPLILNLIDWILR